MKRTLGVLLVLCALPALAAAGEPKTKKLKNIRYDELLLYLTLNSPYVPVANILAMDLPQEDYNEVDDFTQGIGVDIEKVMTSAAPIRDGKIIYGDYRFQLNANHTVKVGSDILSYDTKKTGAENWKAFYNAISQLPLKKTANSEHQTNGWIWSVTRSFLVPLALADDCGDYYCTYDTDFWSKFTGAAGDFLKATVANPLIAGADLVVGAKNAVVAGASAVTSWSHNKVRNDAEVLYQQNFNNSIVCRNGKYDFQYSDPDSPTEMRMNRVSAVALRSILGADEADVPTKCLTENANALTDQLTDGNKEYLQTHESQDGIVKTKKYASRNKNKKHKKPKSDSTAQ